MMGSDNDEGKDEDIEMSEKDKRCLKKIKDEDI